MKKTLLSLSAFISLGYFAQSNVGIGTLTPNNQAILEIKSADKGVLISRLTTTARNTLGTALTAAEDGMLVYDKDMTTFFYWDGPNLQWVQVGSGTGDNWGTQVVQTSGANITGDGTTANPLTVTDGDSDPTNEIELPTGGTNGQVLSTDGSGNYTWANDNGGTDNQNLSLTGNSLGLTNDGTPVDLSGYLDNTDAQNLTSTATGGNATVNISGGTGTTFSINDADADPTNEFNTGANLLGNNLNIIDAGGTQTVSLSPLLDSAYIHDEWKDADSIGGGTFVYAHQALNSGGDTVVISDNGKIGIGISVPVSTLHMTQLDSNTSITIENQFSTTTRYPNISLINYRGTTTGHNYIGFHDAKGSKTSPQSLGVNTSAGQIGWRAYDGTNFSEIARIKAETGSNFSATDHEGSLVFLTGNNLSYTERMRITPEGNVGIGTSTPSAPLEISPNNISALQEGIRLIDEGAGSNEGLWLQFGQVVENDYSRIGGHSENNTSGGIYFSTKDNGDVAPVKRVTIKANGNVGIGVTIPTEKLQVNGSVKIVDGTEGVGKVLTSDATGKASWQFGGVPAGAIMAFDLATCPAGWIVADGTAGTPDLRGEFVRGLDNGRGVDVGRTLGSSQADLFKSHHHSEATQNGVSQSPGREVNMSSGQGIDYGDGLGPVYTDYTGGTETRPRNVALLYCKKQ